MTILYLARHGETVDNVNQIMQGQVQGRLTERGILQACQLRDHLASVPFDAVVSSDLKRAVDTALIVAEPRGLEVVMTPLLRERDWGSFTGRFIPDLKHETWPDDVESLPALQARAQQFLEYVKCEYADKQVLAVGHGIINKAIQAVLYRKQMSEIERMSNCEVRRLAL